MTPNEARKHGLELNQDGVRRIAFELLAYPDIDLSRLDAIWPELGAIDAQDRPSGWRPRRATPSTSTGRRPMSRMMRARRARSIPADSISRRCPAFPTS